MERGRSWVAACWVQRLLADGVDVVWASRYQEITNTYFSSPLGLPDLPVAARDDGRLHTTEAEWKASQLGHDANADRLSCGSTTNPPPLDATCSSDSVSPPCAR